MQTLTRHACFSLGLRALINPVSYKGFITTVKLVYMMDLFLLYIK